MATPRQIAANRSNARKSTGPKTREGRRRSSQNGVLHGLNQPPPHDLVLEFLAPYADEYGIHTSEAHQTDLDRALLAIATADAQIDRVLTVIANAPTHDDERKRAEFWMHHLLSYPRRSGRDAIYRQAIKLIHRCEQNADRRNYSNPKTRNRYLDAALNGRCRAMKRLDALLPQFSEAKPNSPVI
ncbi:hypothetical protein HKCCA1065_01575 [Rhodobacterales bacterium HKCCA1065]|nr:hypothetical protein [Rhodobacterales bacterium HKCCA1065]